MRFSTVAGNLGSADLARDVRGFAVKLYTEEGNWDLVGNNIPVFFIQDAMKFPDLVHAVKEEPDRGWPQAASAHDTFWDFVSLMPESTHMLMWAMSDRAIPRSFRFMEGFGVHTFRFVNADGDVDVREVPLEAAPGPAVGGVERGAQDQRRRPRLPPQATSTTPSTPATSRSGTSASRSSTRTSPTSFDFDVLDATKIIPEELVPLRVIARLTLDRVVDNVFAEVEQVAFCTQNVVPGIDFTNDPLLQGRNFSYLDTQLKRLGSDQLHPAPGERAAVPGDALPARRPHADRAAARAGPRTNPTRSPAPTAVRAPTSSRATRPSASPTARPAGSGPSSSPTTTARRRQFFDQPDRGRAGAHRECLRLRARQV